MDFSETTNLALVTVATAVLVAILYRIGFSF
jgi:hypothetical protein